MRPDEVAAPLPSFEALDDAMVTLEQSFEPIEIKPDRFGHVCDVVQTVALVVIARALLRRR